FPRSRCPGHEEEHYTDAPTPSSQQAASSRGLGHIALSGTSAQVRGGSRLRRTAAPGPPERVPAAVPASDVRHDSAVQGDDAAAEVPVLGALEPGGQEPAPQLLLIGPLEDRLGEV